MEYVKQNDVTPYSQATSSSTKQRLKIQRKAPPKVWEKNGRSGKQQAYVISDGESKTRATAFDNVDTFDTVQEQGKTYTFTNFLVRVPSNLTYHTYSYPFELIFNESTQLEEVDDIRENINLNSVRITPLDQIKLKVQEQKQTLQSSNDGKLPPIDTFNVQGIIQNIGEQNRFQSKRGRSQVRREIDIIDNTKYRQHITLWGNLAESCDDTQSKEVTPIQIQGLAYNSYDSNITITSDFEATIDIDPNIDTAKQLKQWYLKEGNTVSFESIISTNTSGNNTINSTYNNDANEIQKIKPSTLQILSDINDIEIHRAGVEAQHYYSVIATITSVRRSSNGNTIDIQDGNDKQHSPQSYLACSECMKKVVDNTAKECPQCFKPLKATYRYILSFCISDDSGKRWVTAFNDVSEKQLTIPADKLEEYHRDDIEKYESYINNQINNTFLFRLRARLDVREGNEYNIRLSVINCQPIDNCEAITGYVDDIYSKLKSDFILE